MKIEKFNINEITTIVMSMIEQIEVYEMTGIEEEPYIPKPIVSKIEGLDKEEREDFYSKITYISEEVNEIKSGELNMLNNLRGEIGFLAEEILKDYLEE